MPFAPDGSFYFSVDGRDWSYRDPRNLSNQNRNDGLTINPDSQPFSNPLYDYSYGNIRDAAQALGISNINGLGEVQKILDYVRSGGGGGTAAQSEPTPKEDTTINPSYEPRPLDTSSVYTPMVEGKTVADQVGPDYTPNNETSGMDISSNLARYGTDPNVFGSDDFTKNMMQGYTVADMLRFVEGNPDVTFGSDRIKNFMYGGGIETMFGQDVVGDPSQRDYFGGMDYRAAKLSGYSDLAIRNYLDQNPNLLRDKNVKGGGGLYDEIDASLPKPIEPIPAKITTSGGTGLGSQSNASGIRFRRSESSRSGTNSKGTQQFNRNMRISGINV